MHKDKIGSGGPLFLSVVSHTLRDICAPSIDIRHSHACKTRAYKRRGPEHGTGRSSVSFRIKFSSAIAKGVCRLCFPILSAYIIAACGFFRWQVFFCLVLLVIPFSTRRFALRMCWVLSCPRTPSRAVTTLSLSTSGTLFFFFFKFFLYLFEATHARASQEGDPEGRGRAAHVASPIAFDLFCASAAEQRTRRRVDATHGGETLESVAPRTKGVRTPVAAATAIQSCSSRAPPPLPQHKKTHRAKKEKAP
nr:hypothetical protein [Pandoravirus massiliensis]